MRKESGLIAAGILLAMTFATPIAAVAEAAPASAQGRYVAQEVLVQFLPGAPAADRANARSAVKAVAAETITTAAMRSAGAGELVLMRLPVGLTVPQAIDRLGQARGVRYAEPNWVYQHQATSDDPYYTNASLWGMYGDETTPANQYGSRAGEVWAAADGKCGSVTIGIIDEGYMYTHEDLAANAGTNPGESLNGVDDDGNGYVDDVYGYDFANNNASVFDGADDDHGTHVAGTIGAVGGNGKGVAGVCWSVKLIGAKFLGRNGGTTANAVKAVDYFTDLKTRHGLDLVATNNSWGGGGYSQALFDAIDRAKAANILFVAAAGNGGSDGVGDNNDSVPHYPSSYANSNIIAVASITSTGARSSFSNYGKSTVDLGAPGSGITSTLPRSVKGKIVSAYGSYSGTSMATPHVTGAVALYAARHSGVRAAADIKAAILGQAAPTPSLQGITVTGDRLNVEAF